ncbi:uncharacterized protein [Epargyreus clarus]|uniref:uncharacterized protein isoform X2 n=1 Tax=Epargyreus clarus TaxID=520877 RepID=UPI003C2AC8FD
MSFHVIKCSLLLIFLVECCINGANASQQNKTSHRVRKTSTDGYKMQKLPTYRSYQPVSIKYGNAIYVRPDERPDYDINSYDGEYGGVVSNFTSSVYDDNPPLYPNPEALANTNQGKFIENKLSEPDIDLPDDSLADADLAEHNVIDSVTYLYGYTNCQDDRKQYVLLIFIASAIAVLLLLGTLMYLMASRNTVEFRRKSKLYPIVGNLCLCLAFCTMMFIQAVVGVSSQVKCEQIALFLHYSHITCAMWILVLAAAVTEYCVFDTISPIKYFYLFGYGVPAILVMFDFALSMEQYETKHYCWMSIEKGMVMGFMVPAMILIILNTALIIIGLQSVNKKQAEMLTVKIQELVDHHISNWPKSESGEMNQQGSVETLDNSYSGEHSRKNTDSSDSLDKEYDDDGSYVNGNGDGNAEPENEGNKRAMQDKNQLNMLFMDNLSMKWSWNTEGNELKAYLNLCLILEPFFAINWVMGVVAIENASHWSTPAIYLVLVLAMNVYLMATVCTNLPIVRDKNAPTAPACEEVVVEPQTTATTRTTDSMPLLDPAVSQPSVTPAPADTISTISI